MKLFGRSLSELSSLFKSRPNLRDVEPAACREPSHVDDLVHETLINQFMNLVWLNQYSKYYTQQAQETLIASSANVTEIDFSEIHNQNITKFTELLKSNLSALEISELIAFYKSPAGSKLVQLHLTDEWLNYMQNNASKKIMVFRPLNFNQLS